MTEIEDAYLAGYLEKAGGISIYTKERADRPRAHPDAPEIASAGIVVSVEDSDPAALRLLESRYDGNLSHPPERGYRWRVWNEDAARLLNHIKPHLRRGERRALVDLVLSAHEIVQERREFRRPGRPLRLTPSDIEDIEILLEATDQLG